ncbi:TPA: phage baseplate assembly protein V [Klebsiella pneumoniae]|nr:phage baseplate assembly protein V [Klebsiella pneumoniae]HBR1366660.1 phage baseplate assembly protein V [Klebsiella pneumoniae]HBR2015013.1 phage baseplate assembly protein V [Klebsiella pneumoniae]
MNIAEIARLLSNIFRLGVVEQVSESGRSVRVRSGKLLTTWIRWNVTRAGEFSIWLPPAVGEEVWIGCPGGDPETAFVLGSAYSDDNPAPGKSLHEIVITAPDGARFSYDADSGALSAEGIKSAVVCAEVSVTLNSPLVKCTNELETRTLTVTEGGALHGDITHSDGRLSSNGIVVHAHRHGGVRGGNDMSGNPE